NPVAASWVGPADEMQRRDYLHALVPVLGFNLPDDRFVFMFAGDSRFEDLGDRQPYYHMMNGLIPPPLQPIQLAWDGSLFWYFGYVNRYYADAAFCRAALPHMTSPKQVQAALPKPDGLNPQLLKAY